MRAIEQQVSSPQRPILPFSRIPKIQIILISVFWLALNFHWASLGIIIIPGQVYKLVGELHKGEGLAFVLVPGAFVSLFANPLFGLLSDQLHGRFARWGRRRPFILLGTLVNIAALLWMALSSDLVSLMLAYLLVQFSSNAAQAPFHALLPDIVPVEQRGLASGVMGLMSVLGNIGGVVVTGLFVNANHPSAQYHRELLLAYGSIIAVLLIFMLVTILTVHEPAIDKIAEPVTADEQPSGDSIEVAVMLPARHAGWFARALTRARVLTVGGTLGAIALIWGLLTLWNWLLPGLHISSNIEQVVLEVVATVGLLRIFEFHPLRNPDFAWVLLTRLLMMMGIYTIQDFLQFYLRDVLRVSNPEQTATVFTLLVAVTSLVSTLVAGWLSDRFGRKRIVYIAGLLMGAVGLVFMVTQSLVIIVIAGAIFGLGYGAYTSVDWALVADVLPSRSNYARDMGVWNISLSLPQVIAPVIGGPLIDLFVGTHQPMLGFQLLFMMCIGYCLLGTVTVRFIHGVAR